MVPAQTRDEDAGVPVRSGDDDDAGISMARAVSVASRCTVSCALLDDGDVRCWGVIYMDGHLDGHYPDGAVPATIRDLHHVKQLTVGCHSACGLMEDGTVRCWGPDILGNGNRDETPVPEPILGVSNATQISAGDGHTCAVISDGSVRCWGYNSSGELGDGTTGFPLQSVVASGLHDATRVTAGYGDTYAWTAQGEIYAWGFNDYAELGLADRSIRQSQLTPALAPRVGETDQIALGYYHKCALRADHTVDCWSVDNSDGQLGRPSGTSQDANIDPGHVVGLSDVAELGPGFLHTCAILSDRKVLCWGDNQYGQLGDGTNNDSIMPEPVVQLQDVKQVAGGEYHTCAVLNDGSVYCWGDNRNSQLGNGTQTSSAVPVRVHGF
jgi:alpha-tubulin suppressor-like RCC1 family protein